MSNLLTVALSNAVVAAGLAVLAALAGRVLRRPALAHALWLLVLLKLVTPPLVSVPIAWIDAETPSPPTSPAPAPVAHEPAAGAPLLVELPDDWPGLIPDAEPEVMGRAMASQADGPSFALTVATPPPPFPWLAILVTCWLTGTVGWFTLAVLRVRRFHRLLRFAEPAPSWLRDEVAELASRLGLDRPPSVWLVPGRLSPMLWAMSGTPRLLVPAELLGTLTAEQRATLLLHELAHYRRGDHWVRLLEMLATGLYWWNPVVWWARAELREAEEQCCDAWVVWALPGAGRTYATALLECLDFLSDSRSPLPAGASGIGKLADLKRRLTMILGGKTPRRLTWAGFLTVLGLGLCFLPLWPTFAQQPDRERPREQPPRDERPRDPRVGDDRSKPDPRDLEKARDELKRAEKELQDNLAKLEAAREKIRAMAEKLRALEGKPGEGRDPNARPEADKIEQIIRTIKAGGGEKRRIIIEIDGDRIRELPSTERRPIAPVPPVPPVPGERGRATPPAAGQNADSNRRIQDLERRLDEVMRALEEMRRSLPRNPGDVRPGENRPDERRAPSGQNEFRPGERRPGDAPRPEERRPGDSARPEERRPDPRPTPRPEERRPGDRPGADRPDNFDLFRSR